VTTTNNEKGNTVNETQPEKGWKWKARKAAKKFLLGRVHSRIPLFRNPKKRQ
jgi:hypothetical protein